MTNATKEALTRVDQILREAGWDRPTPGNQEGDTTTVEQPLVPITTEKLAVMRHSYQTLLGDDHFDILGAILKDGLSVEQAAAKIGRSSEETSRLFQESIRGLSHFVETFTE